MKVTLMLAVALTLLLPRAGAAQVTREDFSVPADPGVELFVREVRLAISGRGPRIGSYWRNSSVTRRASGPS